MPCDAHLGVVRWAVASAVAGEPADPALLRDRDESTIRHVLLSTGLTGFTAGLASRHRLRLPESLLAHLAEQGGEIAERQRRFAGLMPRVLDALAAASVPAIPVKGLALTELAWPHPTERPMADIDLLVPPARRDDAGRALSAAGFALHERSPIEDTFLGWGDGGVGRTDGESAAHNGKVELHPGWVEYLHGYTIDDGGVLTARAVEGTFLGAPCRRLGPAEIVVQCLGHLSASVIRRDVRGLNVLDVVLGVRALDDDAKADLAGLIDALDPRLSAPGLWLVEQVHHGAAVYQGVDAGAALARLGKRARDQLTAMDAASVLRDPNSRSVWAWRSAWVTSTAERTRMARQFAVPPAAELRRRDPDASVAVLHLRRVARGTRRALRH
jgi:hypothetical protein